MRALSQADLGPISGSAICYLGGLRPVTSSLQGRRFICKVGIMAESARQGCCEDQGGHHGEALSTVSGST